MTQTFPLKVQKNTVLQCAMALTFAGGLLLSVGARAETRSPDFAHLEQAIERIRVEHNVPGAAVIVVNQDKVAWNAGFGVSDIETRKPLTPDTMLRIGSVSKIFTAATLVQLARREEFGLEDPVMKYVSPDLFFNRWRQQTPITVAHLLEHTSGFRDWSRAEFDHNDATPLTLEQGLAFAPESRTAHWQPGLHSVYSNANYGLAGRVLEVIAGENYEQAVRERLFVPLEMHHATSLQASTSGLATGYDIDGITPIPYWHMIQRPAAGINATTLEMSALVLMLMNRGKFNNRTILSSSEVERIETPHTSLAARNGLRFGYGLGLYAHYRDGFRFLGHGGDGDGYLSRFGYSRELGLGYFVIINSANQRALNRMRTAIEKEFTRDRVASAAPRPIKLDERTLLRYTGRYQLAAWRFSGMSQANIANQAISIRPDSSGALAIEYSDGERVTLVPVDQRRFRRGNEREATSGFFEHDGELYFQEDENWVRRADPPATAVHATPTAK